MGCDITARLPSSVSRLRQPVVQAQGPIQVNEFLCTAAAASIHKETGMFLHGQSITTLACSSGGTSGGTNFFRNSSIVVISAFSSFSQATGTHILSTSVPPLLELPVIVHTLSSFVQVCASWISSLIFLTNPHTSPSATRQSPLLKKSVNTEGIVFFQTFSEQACQ